MFESVLEQGSTIGMVCLFFGCYVYGHLSANTETRMSESESFNSEVERKFGISAKQYPINHALNAFLGVAATFWLPVYVWVYESFWSALVFFIAQLFAISFLSMIINTKGYFMFWRISPIITTTGFFLTIYSLL